MFEKVLVGVDGRPNGRDAIALASRLNDPGGKLVLAHVEVVLPGPLHVSNPAAGGAESEGALALLARERDAAEVGAELIGLRSSSAGRGLHQCAEVQDADLLVVGSHSRGLFGRVMLGDDTRASLNGAPCAVAIASRGYGELPKPFAIVGVGYDGSPESEMALAAARALAREHRSRIRALQVVSIPTYAFGGLVVPAAGDAIDALISEANERLEGLEGVDGEAEYGLTGEELAAFGDEVDLLVVGSRGYGPWQRLVLGSTGDYLARHARCALLVMPRASRAAGEGRGEPHPAPATARSTGRAPRYPSPG